MSRFKKATTEKVKMRLCLIGPSGAGKTYSALAIATALGEKIALIDSENSSSARYASQFDFDSCDLPDHKLHTYIELIEEASRENYDVIIVDSMSHGWYWELDQVSKAKNSYTAWNPMRQLERKLLDTIFNCNAHFIGTYRSKVEYVLEQDRRGKTVPKKVGTAAVGKDSIEYEFDIVGEMDQEHILSINKTRFSLLDGKTYLNPGANFATDFVKSLGGTIKERVEFNSPAKVQLKEPEVIREVPEPSEPEWLGTAITYYKDKGLDEVTIRAMAQDFYQDKDGFKNAMADILRSSIQ